MKKNMLVLFIASTFGVSVAAYRISVPMEVTNGGSLQNGSITFTGGTPLVVEPPASTNECLSPVVSSTGWRVHKTTGVISVLWNGQIVSTGNASGTTSVSANNGIVYTQDQNGSIVSNAFFNFYGVCRNIPGDFNGGTWVSIAPVTSAWIDNGSAYNCTWTPDSNDYLPSQSVEQTGSNCKQNQTRTSQAREQNDSTFVIRDIGEPIVENQDIDSYENPTRTVAGTDMTTEPETCGFDRLNGWYWSESYPDAETSFVSWKRNTVFNYNTEAHIGIVTQIVSDGITYKRSTLMLSDDTQKDYAVCRVNQ